MEFYLVRHGRTELNGQGLLLGNSDPDLADINDPLIVDWKNTLKEHNFTHLIHSGMKRTEQTIQLLAKELALDYPLLIDKRIRELDFGDWELKSYDWLYQNEIELFSRWIANPYDTAPPNGETLQELKKRICEFFEEWSHKKVEGLILIATHGGPIRLLWSFLHQTDVFDKEVAPATVYQLNWSKKTISQVTRSSGE